MWGVVTVVFLLFNVLPGDPARMMLDQREDAEQLKNIRAKYGFDKPLSTQYVLYLNDLSPISLHSQEPNDYSNLESKAYSYFKLGSIKHTDIVIKFPYLRTSYKKSGKLVSHIISGTLPNTVVLALSSILIAIVLGVFIGILAAIFKDTWIANWPTKRCCS